MGVVTVRVYTLSDVPPDTPIVGSTVRIYDSTGTTFITAGVTNALGYFQFDVIGTPTPGTTYQARCSKTGIGFTSPELIAVLDPLPVGVDNNFVVYGTVFVLPVATDAYFCRCSGFFINAGGVPLDDLMLRFVNMFDPVIVDNRCVSGSLEVRTDALGYAVVDLVRSGKYTAQLAGLHDERLNIIVPDRTSISLIDLLFPVVYSITFDIPGPWTMAVGSSVVLTPAVLSSTFVTMEGTANGDVEYSTADSSVASIQTGEDSITIVGVRAGSTTLVLTRRDDSIIRNPNPDIIGTGVAITVV
jgi:hypothetical protein